MLNDTITKQKTFQGKGTYKIKGGNSLNGNVSLPGAKNAALPALVAASLSSHTVTLSNVPLKLNDVKLLIELLESIGVGIKIIDSTTIELNGSNVCGGSLDGEKAGKIRHSLLLLGLCASKGVSLSLPIPGGCSIGNRKHDLHIKALKAIGFNISEPEMGINLDKRVEYDASGTLEVDFHYPTFGGTFNAIFSSVLVDGCRITIKNPAKNPEVVDVVNMLNGMGAIIDWDNNKNLIITGVKSLRGTRHNVMSDRIIAATIIVAIGATRGEGIIKGADSRYLQKEIDVWKKVGLTINSTDEGIYVKGNGDILPVDIETGAYPAFHTDIQPLHGILMTVGKGTASIKDIILDGRFEYCNELNKLGANIDVMNGNFTCVNGAIGQIAKFYETKQLKGSPELIATDIRGGAAVLIGALVAEGESVVSNIYQIERGYTNLPEIFNELGAEIQRNN